MLWYGVLWCGVFKRVKCAVRVGQWVELLDRRGKDFRLRIAFSVCACGWWWGVGQWMCVFVRLLFEIGCFEGGSGSVVLFEWAGIG